MKIYVVKGVNGPLLNSRAYYSKSEAVEVLNEYLEGRNLLTKVLSGATGERWVVDTLDLE